MIHFTVKEVTVSNQTELADITPFEIVGDATPSYKKYITENPNATKADVEKFLLQYIEKKTKSVTGLGYKITLNKEHENTRKRPYTVTNVVKEGRTKWKKTYTIVDCATGRPYFSTTKTKDIAQKLTKEAYKNGTITTDVYCIESMQVANGDPVAFTASYTPSNKTQDGKYIVFGITRD